MPLNASNSYATVSEADAFAVDHPYGDGWTALDADRKAQLLILASAALLDRALRLGRFARQRVAGTGLPAHRPADPERRGLCRRRTSRRRSSWRPGSSPGGSSAEDLTDDQVVADLRISKAGDTSFGEGVRRKVVPDAVADIIPSSWYVQSSTQAAAGGVLALPLERA